jgi:hypothetical protein
VRSYGSNASSSAAGKTVNGLGLTIDSTHAAMVSFGGGNRIVRRNHTNNSLTEEETQAAQYCRLLADGAGGWWGGAPSNAAAEPGLWSIGWSGGVLSGSARIDGGSGYSQGSPRRNKFRSGNEWQDGAYFGGRLYTRGIFEGIIRAWTTGGSYVDEFAWPGAAAAAAHYGHSPGQFLVMITALQAKIGFYGGVASEADEFLAWASNADNGTANQSFLISIPCSVATATWTYTGWSSGVNTLKGFALGGVNLSAETTRVRVKKNAGAFITVPFERLGDAAWWTANIPTFTDGDTLTVELAFSVWDRLDGHASLVAVRNKLTPSEVAGLLTYDDAALSQLAPYAAPGFKGRFGGTGTFKGKVGG